MGFCKDGDIFGIIETGCVVRKSMVSPVSLSMATDTFEVSIGDGVDVDVDVGVNGDVGAGVGVNVGSGVESGNEIDVRKFDTDLIGAVVVTTGVS